MANPWFRLYSEFADDPKVQMLPEAMQRRLVMLFCARCKCDGPVTFRETELAFQWRVTMDELSETRTLFIEQGFIDEQWNLLNWNKRQFLSDSSTDRTRQYRERKRTSQERHRDGGEQDVTVTVTPPDTEQIQNRAETEQKLLSIASTAHAVSPLEVVTIWNEATAGKLPTAKLTPKRKTTIQTRLKEPGWLEDFRAACAFLANTPWYAGDNDRRWTATLDFALQPGKATELAEKATQPARTATDLQPPMPKPQTAYEREREEQFAERKRIRATLGAAS